MQTIQLLTFLFVVFIVFRLETGTFNMTKAVARAYSEISEIGRTTPSAFK